MPKKRRPPKYAELDDARLHREQEWAHEQYLAHLPYSAMRLRAMQPAERGGLGVALSEHALRGLVKGYQARMREVYEVDPDEQLARSLHDLDALQRLVGGQLDADKAEGKRVDPALVREYRAVDESRRKLIALDAPAVSKVEVTQRDAVDAALAELFADAGVKTPEKKDEARP